MDLNCRDRDGRNRVAQGYAGMGVRCSIEDYDVRVAFGFLDPCHQFSLEVGLPELDVHPCLPGLFPDLPFDICQGVPAINLRFPGSQQIEIGSIEEKDVHEGAKLGRNSPKFNLFDPLVAPADPTAILAKQTQATPSPGYTS